MSLNQWAYLGIIAAFGIVFIALIRYYFNKNRYDDIEKPKYKMLDETDDE